MAAEQKKYQSVEEMLADVSEELEVDYFREAVVCYNAGAYRACVVMTYNSVFASLRHLLDNLEQRKLKFSSAIRKEVEERVAKAEAYEGHLSARLKQNGYVTSDESSALETIQKLRHQAAHATGTTGYQEAAWIVMTLAVRHFLGERSQLPELRVAILMEQLGLPGFFSAEDSIEHITDIVKCEMEQIPVQVHAKLVGQLVEKATSGDVTAAENAESFLCGLASLSTKDSSRSTVTYLNHIARSAIRNSPNIAVESHAFLNGLFAVCPALFEHVDEKSAARLDALFAALCRESQFATDDGSSRNPFWMFQSMVETLSPTIISTRFRLTAQSFLEKCWREKAVAALLLKAGYGTSLAMLILGELRSSDFDEAGMMELLTGIEPHIPQHLDGKDAFSLVEAMPAGKQDSPFRAVIDARYSRFPRLRDAAALFAWQNFPDDMDVYGLVYPSAANRRPFGLPPRVKVDVAPH